MLFNKQTKVQYVEALVSLSSTREWEVVKSFLEVQLQDWHKSMDVLTDDVRLRMLQGRCQAISELIDTVGGSKKILAKLVENNDQDDMSEDQVTQTY